MRNLIWILVVLAALGFVLAVISSLMGRTLVGVSPEAYSRACTNLALIAISLVLMSWRRAA